MRGRKSRSTLTLALLLASINPPAILTAALFVSNITGQTQNTLIRNTTLSINGITMNNRRYISLAPNDV